MKGFGRWAQEELHARSLRAHVRLHANEWCAAADAIRRRSRGSPHRLRTVRRHDCWCSQMSFASGSQKLIAGILCTRLGGEQTATTTLIHLSQPDGTLHTTSSSSTQALAASIPTTQMDALKLAALQALHEAVESSTERREGKGSQNLDGSTREPTDAPSELPVSLPSEAVMTQVPGKGRGFAGKGGGAASSSEAASAGDSSEGASYSSVGPLEHRIFHDKREGRLKGILMKVLTNAGWHALWPVFKTVIGHVCKEEVP